MIGIGSPRASLESNYALRELVGAEHFYDGHAAAEGPLVGQGRADPQRQPAVRIPNMRDIEDADAAFVLGEDVTNTAPRIGLALRQTARGRQATLAAAKHIAEWQAAALADIGQHEKNPLFIASLAATRLDDIAAAMRSAPRRKTSPASVSPWPTPSTPARRPWPAWTRTMPQLAKTIADALLAAKRPLVVSGTGAGSGGGD